MIRSHLALAALATAAVPGMRPVSVAAIRSGEDNPLHQSALVEDVTGRKWVVRSPLGPAAGAELDQNDQLVRQLGKHLPFKVPAPAGYAELGPDGRAAVYPYVEGLGLSFRHLPQGPGLASAVGRAIAAVHNMPHELFEEHAVPVFDAVQVRARKLAELDRAAETGHVPNGLLARWEQALDAGALWQFATTPTHGSLDGSSFLVVFSEDDDAASGRVVGLTGWERAQVADPGEDFARLVEQSHPRSVDAVFESYSMARSQRPDGYLLNRARLAAEMRLLNGLVGAVASGDDAFVRSRADELRKLDRLTANDDSLVPRTALGTDGSSVPVDVQDDNVATARTDLGTTGSVAGVRTEPPAPADRDDAGSEGEAADDEPAFVVEPPSDGAHLEPAHPHAADASSRPSPSDVTAPIPVFRPVDATAAESAEQELEAAHGEAQQSERADTEPAEAEPADTEPADTEPAEAEPEELAATGAEVPSEPAEPGASGPPRAAEPDDAADPDVADLDEAPPEVTQPPTAEAPQDTASDTAGSTPLPHDRSDGGPADEQAEREAEERLHTIYGMPDSDEPKS